MYFSTLNSFFLWGVVKFHFFWCWKHIQQFREAAIHSSMNSLVSFVYSVIWNFHRNKYVSFISVSLPYIYIVSTYALYKIIFTLYVLSKSYQSNALDQYKTMISLVIMLHHHPYFFINFVFYLSCICGLQ